MATVLATGKASRLYRRLVLEKQIAQSVEASQQSIGSQSVFSIEVVARPGVSTDTLQKEVDAVLAEVRKNGITQDELTRARTRYDTRMLSGLQSVGGFGGKADALQNYNHFVGEPDYLRKDLARYQALSTEDVKRYANEQLRPDMRVVLHAVPSQQAPTAPKETK
jgi:predicted Zn-dependent peptidase